MASLQEIVADAELAVRRMEQDGKTVAGAAVTASGSTDKDMTVAGAAAVTVAESGSNTSTPVPESASNNVVAGSASVCAGVDSTTPAAVQSNPPGFVLPNPALNLSTANAAAASATLANIASLPTVAGLPRQAFPLAPVQHTQVPDTNYQMREFACTWRSCRRRFRSRSELQRHQRTHLEIRPYLCRFPGCGRRFTELTTATRHLGTHTRMAPYKCPVEGCGQGFSRGSSLKRHMQQLHLVAAGSDLMRAATCLGQDDLTDEKLRAINRELRERINRAHPRDMIEVVNDPVEAESNESDASAQATPTGARKTPGTRQHGQSQQRSPQQQQQSVQPASATHTVISASSIPAHMLSEKRQRSVLDGAHGEHDDSCKRRRRRRAPSAQQAPIQSLSELLSLSAQQQLLWALLPNALRGLLSGTDPVLAALSMPSMLSAPGAAAAAGMPSAAMPSAAGISLPGTPPAGLSLQQLSQAMPTMPLAMSQLANAGANAGSDGASPTPSIDMTSAGGMASLAGLAGLAGLGNLPSNLSSNLPSNLSGSLPSAVPGVVLPNRSGSASSTGHSTDNNNNTGDSLGEHRVTTTAPANGANASASRRHNLSLSMLADTVVRASRSASPATSPLPVSPTAACTPASTPPREAKARHEATLNLVQAAVQQQKKQQQQQQQQQQ
ncbi:MAG: hypothetical protein MHM6MM_004303 [Cercozoa sp. M6MM]